MNDGIHYLDFMAVDRTLSRSELDQLYEAIPEAEITADRMVMGDEYYGMGEEYALECLHTWFDAMVHWIEDDLQRLALRFSARVVGVGTLRPFRLEADTAGVTFQVDGSWTVLDMWAEGVEGSDFSEAESALEELVGLRAEITGGDMRGPYLAWLAALRAWELSDDEEDAFASTLEPPVPPGLSDPTAPQLRLVEFLGVDADLLAAAARASAPLHRPSAQDVRESVAGLDPAVKDELLVGLALGEEARVRTELTRLLSAAGGQQDVELRTAAELLDEADRLRIARDREAGLLGPG